MVAEAMSDFLTPEFVLLASRELQSLGFISDEHQFAPYRDTITHYTPEIERAVNETGKRFSLHPGFVKNHPEAGYSYFLYDTNRYPSQHQAEQAVSIWLDEKYSTGD